MAAAEASGTSPSAVTQLAQWRGPLVVVGSALSLLILVLVVAREEPPVTSAPHAAAVSQAIPAKPAAVATTTPVAEPVTSFDLNRAGVAAYQNGDFAAALERLEQAVKKNPEDPGARNDLGQVLVRLGRADEAVPHFVRATELNRSAWAPRFNLANAYGVMGDWGRAIPEYQRADTLFPDDYVTVYNLGLAYHKAGDEEPAVKAFRRAIELAPGEPIFHLSLGISYEQLNRKADAADAYEKYLEMAPTVQDAEKIRVHVESLRKPAQS